MRNEIAVVEPRAAGRRRNACDRIRDGVVVVQVARGILVLADVHLHGRLAVAEDVVGEPAARRDVLVVDAVGSRKTELRRQEVCRPDRLFRRIAPRVIETQRALERHPPPRPLILPI